MFPEDGSLKASLSDKIAEFKELENLEIKSRLLKSHFNSIINDRHTLFSAEKAQKSSAENRILDKIRAENGKILTDKNEILAEISMQYEKLLSSN